MIKEVTDFVEGKLLETLDDAGVERPSFGFGARALDEADAPPRIVWVPVRGNHDKARAAAADQRQTPKHIWTRHVVMEAHIWANCETDAEVLMGHLAATLQRYVGSAASSMVGEEWAPSDVAGSAGIKLVAGFQLHLPLTTEPLKLVKPETVAVAGTIEEAA